jgi:hypothetical protein
MHPAMYGSFADAELSSSIVRENGGCDLFFGVASAGQAFGLGYNNFTGATLCHVPNAGVGATSVRPELTDGFSWILDLLSRTNVDTGFVDGAEAAFGPDVDRTATDRGAYGGRWGEVHYLLLTPSGQPWLLVTLPLAFVLGTLLRRRVLPRRSGSRQGTRSRRRR